MSGYRVCNAQLFEKCCCDLLRQCARNPQKQVAFLDIHVFRFPKLSPLLGTWQCADIWDHNHLRPQSFETTIIWDHNHLRPQSFETTVIWDHNHWRPQSFETTTFETCSLKTTFTWDFFMWDHIHLRPHSFYATLKCSCFYLLCITFWWSNFHFFAGDLKFFKATPLRVQGWITLGCKNTRTYTREARKPSYLGLGRERCSSEMSFC